MAATGYTPISLYYSTTAAAQPTNTNLVNGELAINITDGKLYYKDNTGTVQLLASKATTAGAVTSISVASANGLAGTSSGGTTPTLTLRTSITGMLKGNGTAISAAVSGTDYAPATSGTSILYGNGSGGFSNVTIGSGVSFAGGTLSATGTGGTVTSVTGTSPVASSGGTTPAISLSSGYGDTQNPYASKTANYFLAAPNGASGVPTFRAMVAADVPTLNQNTTGSAAKWTTARNLAGNSVDGSANVAFSNKFIVQGTTDAGLSGAQFLGALGTGLVKNTTTTGVLSIASAGTDYAPATSGTSILYGNGSGGFSNVTIGTGLSFSTGTLTATGTGGTVTSVSVVSANGLAGTVANATTTPAITISTSVTGMLKGNGTAISAGTANTDYLVPALANTAVTGFKTATFNSQTTIATTTGAITVDWTSAQNQKQTEPTGTITYTFTAPPGPCHLQLIIDSDGTSTAQTINWPGTVVWMGTTWSGTNNKKAVINFWYDGTNYFAVGTNQV